MSQSTPGMPGGIYVKKWLYTLYYFFFPVTILCKYFHCCVLLHCMRFILQFIATIGDLVKNLAINEKKIVVNLL